MLTSARRSTPVVAEDDSPFIAVSFVDCRILLLLLLLSFPEVPLVV